MWFLCKVMETGNLLGLNYLEGKRIKFTVAKVSNRRSQSKELVVELSSKMFKDD